MRKPITKPTISTVARLAGVSVGTVSNVLNDTKPVSGARRDRVLKAAEEVGYFPSRAAQALRRKRTRMVGLCVTHASSAYLDTLVDTFDTVALKLGYEMVHVFSRQDPERELRMVRELLSWNLCGLVFLPSLEPQPALDVIQASGVPAVVVDRICADHRFDYVTIDNRSSMVGVVRHLIDLGHRHLVFAVAHLGVVTTLHRIEGLKSVLEVLGDGVTADVFQMEAAWDDFSAHLGRALRARPRPTAIITGNSTVALATLRALAALGVRCPEDVSLVTFDDPEWAEIMTPGLSVVHHPIDEMALTGWDLLIQRIDGNVENRSHITIPARIVWRDSVAPLNGRGASSDAYATTHPGEGI